jgi:hypothetical protein
MGNSTVKLGYTSLTSAALVDKGRNINTMCTGNTAFTLPAALLTDLGKACDELEALDEQVLFHGGRIAYQAKRAKEVEVKAYIKEVAGYIQAQSNGEEALILSAGFEVRAKAKPVDQLQTVQNLRPVLTDVTGNAKLRWDSQPYATNYLVFCNATDPNVAAAWELVAYTSKSSYTVEALVSAKFYYFRVQALGRKGLKSQVSQVVRALAA